MFCDSTVKFKRTHDAYFIFLVYYDPRALSPNLDFIVLEAFDFYTPARNPKEADYPSPLYELVDRKLDENIDAQVKYW